MSRRHNDANVLCLSADLLGEELIERMLRIWLETEFESGRHARRVEKITRFEAGGPDAQRHDSPQRRKEAFKEASLCVAFVFFVSLW